jgi:probable phosphoglycerate mutase
MTRATVLPNVCLVRHGETAWTITGQRTSRTDIPLTSRGEAEARALTMWFHRMRFSDVFTSPLQRARRTCELAGFGARAVLDSDLMEWDYGEYEGRRTSDILADRPTWRLFEHGCPKGESVDDVEARANQIVARVRGCSGDVLLFTHGDISRVLAARWLRFPASEGRRFFLGTGSVSVLGYDHGSDEPVIRLWNRSPQ